MLVSFHTMYIFVCCHSCVFVLCYLFYFSSGLCIICYALVSVCFSERKGTRDETLCLGVGNVISLDGHLVFLRIVG